MPGTPTLVTVLSMNLAWLVLLALPIEFLPSKYDGMPRCEEIKAAAPADRAAAVAAVRKCTGLDWADREEIRIRFQDASSDPEAAKGARMALRRTEVLEGREIVAITLFWEYLMTGQADAREEITHEYVHAVHRLNVPRERYLATPRWVREGLALHVAGQGPARVRWILQDRIEAGPDALVDGLEPSGRGHDQRDYAEDWLAFRYIEEEHGAERLRAVMRDLIAGRRDWQDAVRTHTGEDAESFVGKARSHARGTVRAIEGGVREELLPWLSRARDPAADAGETVTGLREFLRRRPDAYCAPRARLALAEAELARGEVAAARAGFLELLSRYPEEVADADAARFGLVRCAEAAGDSAAEARERAALERDYPLSRHRRDTGSVEPAAGRGGGDEEE